MKDSSCFQGSLTAGLDVGAVCASQGPRWPLAGDARGLEFVSWKLEGALGVLGLFQEPSSKLVSPRSSWPPPWGGGGLSLPDPFAPLLTRAPARLRSHSPLLSQAGLSKRFVPLASLHLEGPQGQQNPKQSSRPHYGRAGRVIFGLPTDGLCLLPSLFWLLLALSQRCQLQLLGSVLVFATSALSCSSRAPLASTTALLLQTPQQPPAPPLFPERFFCRDSARKRVSWLSLPQQAVFLR